MKWIDCLIYSNDYDTIKENIKLNRLSFFMKGMGVDCCSELRAAESVTSGLSAHQDFMVIAKLSPI